MVHALQYAHSKELAHCDVRTPNMLIVPPAEVMARIAAAHLGDKAENNLTEEETVRQMIQLDKCRFLLIDWGESEDIGAPDGRWGQRMATQDLKMLLWSLNKLQAALGLNALGRFIYYGANYKPKPDWLFSKKLMNSFCRFAERLEYDKLANKLGAYPHTDGLQRSVGTRRSERLIEAAAAAAAEEEEARVRKTSTGIAHSSGSSSGSDEQPDKRRR
jgi:hypothetical protein